MFLISLRRYWQQFARVLAAEKQKARREKSRLFLLVRLSFGVWKYRHTQALDPVRFQEADVAVLAQGNLFGPVYVFCQVCASSAGQLMGRQQQFMVDLAVQLVERAFMESQVQEAACLIDNAQALAAFVSIGLYPGHGRAGTTDVFQAVADGPALAVARGIVRQPHTVQLQVLSLCSVCHHFASSGRIEGIAPLQDANERSLAVNAQVQVAVVDYAVAVVVFDDDGAGCSTRDLGHIEVGRAESLRPCFPHDVAGRSGQGRQPVAQDRRMVWSAFCGHGASTREAPRPA